MSQEIKKGQAYRPYNSTKVFVVRHDGTLLGCRDGKLFATSRDSFGRMKPVLSIKGKSYSGLKMLSVHWGVSLQDLKLRLDDPPAGEQDFEAEELSFE